MASNYVFGGPGYPNGNMLSYNLKNLSLGSNQIAQIGEPYYNNTGTTLSANNPGVGLSADNLLANSYVTSNNRSFDGSEFTTGSMSPNIRQSLLSFSNSNVNLNNQNVPSYKVPDNFGFSSKVSEDGIFNSGYRPRVPGVTGSHILSNLQDNCQQSFNSNINSDTCAAFVSSRFGSRSGESVINRINSNKSSQSHNNLTSSFDAVSTSSQAFSNYVPLMTRQTDNRVSLPIGQNTSPNLEGLGDLHSTRYYTNQQLETTKKLQACGSLKAASWILVPPVPEATAAHMRTGRVHEFKLLNDRCCNPFHIDNNLKPLLRNKLQSCLLTTDDTSKEKLPRNLGAYTDLVPLELLHQPRVSVTFGVPTICFKAWSPRFNRPVLLRRVILPPEHEAALSPDAFYLAKQLTEVDNVTIVKFRDICFTNAFNDNSAILVYDFIPCSYTAQQLHMSDPMKITSFSSPFNSNRTVRPHSAVKNAPSDLGMLQESTIWSYLIQLINGIRFIHQQLNRACGVLDPTKVLIEEGSRLRINCFGLKNILFHSTKDVNIPECQNSDFVHLGKLILGLACGTAAAMQTTQLASSFNLLQRTYRPELVTIVRSLISGQITVVDQLIRASAPFVYEHLSMVYDHSDFLERQLLLEMENDRLFRMVCKLQSIVERSDRQCSSPEWSETGDRYMLKLFRDFVFHQSDQLGAPYLDLSHIVSALNKVEAASPERLCLVSRDSQNVIIVTYADIKQWLDTSFYYLLEKHRQSRCELQIAQQQQQISESVLSNNVNRVADNVASDSFTAPQLLVKDR